jgi:hypothetical protein
MAEFTSTFSPPSRPVVTDPPIPPPWSDSSASQDSRPSSPAHDDLSELSSESECGPCPKSVTLYSSCPRLESHDHNYDDISLEHEQRRRPTTAYHIGVDARRCPVIRPKFQKQLTYPVHFTHSQEQATPSLPVACKTSHKASMLPSTGSFRQSKTPGSAATLGSTPGQSADPACGKCSSQSLSLRPPSPRIQVVTFEGDLEFSVVSDSLNEYGEITELSGHNVLLLGSQDASVINPYPQPQRQRHIREEIRRLDEVFSVEDLPRKTSYADSSEKSSGPTSFPNGTATSQIPLFGSNTASTDGCVHTVQDQASPPYDGSDRRTDETSSRVSKRSSGGGRSGPSKGGKGHRRLLSLGQDSLDGIEGRVSTKKSKPTARKRELQCWWHFLPNSPFHTNKCHKSHQNVSQLV